MSMRILFLVALVLAWPTFGLSIVAWILFFVFKSSRGKNNKAWDGYEECLAHRRNSLSEFRVSAAREVLLIHPDAKLLINNNSRSFLAYSKSDGVLLGGDFNDDNFPKLEIRNENDPEPDIQMAVDTFKKKLECYAPNTVRMNKKYVENPDLYFSMNPDVRRELFEKGYTLYEIAKSDFVVEANVLINGILVASSSFAKPRDNGFFTKEIYNTVAFNKIPSEDGISVLEVAFSIFDYGGVSGVQYEMLFDDRRNFSGGSGFEDFKNIFSGPIAFLSAIEEEIRTPPSEWAEEGDAGWHDTVAGWLRSPLS